MTFTRTNHIDFHITVNSYGNWINSSPRNNSDMLNSLIFINEYDLKTMFNVVGKNSSCRCISYCRHESDATTVMNSRRVFNHQISAGSIITKILLIHRELWCKIIWTKIGWHNNVQLGNTLNEEDKDFLLVLRARPKLVLDSFHSFFVLTFSRVIWFRFNFFLFE